MTEVPTSSAVEQIKKSLCAVCGAIRTCEVKGYINNHWSDQHVWGNTDWYLLQCRGCEYIFCQSIKTFSEEFDHQWDEETQQDVIVYDETVAYFPAVSARKRPSWFSSTAFEWEGPDALHGAMVEMYVALDNDLMRLSAAGIRTAFDIASELLGISPELTFSEKLDELVSTSRINAVDRDRLETLTEAGHASIHRGWIPAADDLGTMAEILEHFVHRAFVEPALQKRLDEKSAKLKTVVPARKARAAKKKR